MTGRRRKPPAICIWSLRRGTFYLLLRIRDLCISHFPVQIKIISDSPPIQYHKPPEAHSFPLLSLLADSNCPIAVPLLKLQIQIAGGFLLLPVIQKIVLEGLKRAYKDLQIIRNEYIRYNQYMLGQKAMAYLEEKNMVDAAR